MERRLDFYTSNGIHLYCDDASYMDASMQRAANTSNSITSLVSVTPRSSTWANHYFWAVLEALYDGGDTIKPYQNFYFFGHDKTLAVGVGHCHAPKANELMPANLREREYPTISGYNYFLNILKLVASEEALLQEPCFRPVLVYRNPRDQITSYSRGLWSVDYSWVKEIAVIIEEEGGVPQPVRNVSEFIRKGGAQAICYYIRSFVDLKAAIGERVFMLPYEKFIQDRAGACIDMVKHIFKGSNIYIPDEMITTAATATSRENLGNFEKTRNLGLSHWHDRNAPGAVRDGKAALHIVSGTSGQWQSVLSDKDIDFINSQMQLFELDEKLFTYD